MEVDGEPSFKPRTVEDEPDNLVDDDDLQAALSRARRDNAKKRTKVKPEDLAAQSELFLATCDLFPKVYTYLSRVAQRNEEEAAPAENGDEDGRITFDDTSEFVRNVNLESLAAPVKRERAATPPVEAPIVIKVERGEDGELLPTAARDEDEDMDSEDEDEELAEMAAREGLSIEEMRLKIDASLVEAANVKEEDAEVCPSLLFNHYHPLATSVYIY